MIDAVSNIRSFRARMIRRVYFYGNLCVILFLWCLAMAGFYWQVFFLNGEVGRVDSTCFPFRW